MSKSIPVSLKEILAAHARVKNYIHRTPVITSSTFNDLYGRNFFFKSENMQKTGSFKARGALNAVTLLKTSDSPPAGVVTHRSGNHGQALAWAAKMCELKCAVITPNNSQHMKLKAVTHSSGNHGQALAWAAKMCGLKCAVIAPNSSPQVKLEAIRGYGADVVMCEPTPDDRQSTCDRVAKDRGYHFVPPYDHADVIAGQGTIAVEFLEQEPSLDAILVPASGGGMISGIAIAAKTIKPNIKVFLVEPEGKDVERCLRAGERLWPNPPKFLDTIADGIRLQQLGHITWPIIMELVEKEVFTANNEEIIKAMKFVFQRMKTVIESASGAGVAAAMSDRLRNMDPAMKNVGVILCGGNTDIDHLPWYK